MKINHGLMHYQPAPRSQPSNRNGGSVQDIDKMSISKSNSQNMDQGAELNNDFYESLRHLRKAQGEIDSPQANNRGAQAYHIKDSSSNLQQQNANIDI